jgi:chromosome segregation ATPase
MSKFRLTTLVLVSQFSSCVILKLPDSNKFDLDKEIDDLNQEFEQLDEDLETFTKELRDSESEIAEDENGPTELTKYIDKRQSKKDDLIGTVQYANKQLEEKSITLGLIHKSTKDDLESLEKIHSQLEDEDFKDVAEQLISRLHNHQVKSEDLLEKLDNKLAPILPEDEKPSRRFAQDSSEVQQTEFDSFEPFGDE